MELLTVRQAAAELSVSARRVRQFCQEGRIGTLYGYMWLITREELEEFKKLDRPSHRPAKRTKSH